MFTTYLGFDPLNQYFDPSGDSIRHAGYVDVRRRVSRGLTFTANYTYAKSIDIASDASPDTRVLSIGQARQQFSLGGAIIRTVPFRLSTSRITLRPPESGMFRLDDTVASSQTRPVW